MPTNCRNRQLFKEILQPKMKINTKKIFGKMIANDISEACLTTIGGKIQMVVKVALEQFAFPNSSPDQNKR